MSTTHTTKTEMYTLAFNINETLKLVYAQSALRAALLHVIFVNGFFTLAQAMMGYVIGYELDIDRDEVFKLMVELPQRSAQNIEALRKAIEHAIALYILAEAYDTESNRALAESHRCKYREAVSRIIASLAR